MAMIAVTMLALSAASVREREYVTGIAGANERMVQENAVDAAIFASMGDGLIVTDRNDRVVLVNPQAEKLLSRSGNEMIGKKYFDAVPMQDENGNPVSAQERPLGLAVAGRERKTSSGLAEDARYYVRSDGSRFPVAFTNTPVILDGKVIGAIDIFRDASSTREIDRAKSEFVSLAAHQLRTPLSVIAMHAELMKKQDQLFAGHDERMCADYASEIHSVAMRMADLINDLLNVSRIDTRTLVVTPSAVNLRRIMEGILREVAIKFANKDITIETSYPDPQPEFVTDPHLLEIVMENLLGNAFKYTPEGGRVSVKVSDTPQEIVITITDTGQGIPHSQHGEVFKKFFRASNARKIASEGTGLGLYIAKSIVERLNGEISFNSKEGEGTTFTVRLPKENESRHAEDVAAEPLAPSVYPSRA